MYHAEQTAARPLVHYWRQQLHSQQRQTVLDLNDEQCCLHGCDIMNMKMSPSHQRAAFAAVRDGSPELLVLEVEKGAFAAPVLRAGCLAGADALVHCL